MEVQGKIIAVMPERGGVSQRGTEWKVQEYVLEVFGQYPKKIAFEVFGADKIQRFNIQIGQDVLVAFDIDAHEWNGRWFNSVRAFDVRPLDSTQMGGASAPAVAPVSPGVQTADAASATPVEMAANDAPDDLPF